MIENFTASDLKYINSEGFNLNDLEYIKKYKQDMKAIFLDIDWVLIKIKENSKYVLKLNEELIKNLYKIIQETWASIVLSSSWGKNKILVKKIKEDFQEFSRKYCTDKVDLWDYVVWHTINYHNRWIEILTFIFNYNKKIINPPIREFVVIDDEDFNLEIFKKLNKLVLVSPEKWLDEEAIDRAIEILNN